VKLDGFFGDAAYTFAFPEVAEETMKLLRITKESLYKGIEQAVVGNRVGDIGFAVQNHTEFANKYGVVRDLVGHGIGRNLHEEPNVPNYGRRGQGLLLKDGLVIAIEPMINMGTKDVRTAPDNWTIVTKDNRPSAHYEHTVVVRKGAVDILSDHADIEEEIKNNSEIRNIQ
jgi:methionyl aminopeptidase